MNRLINAVRLLSISSAVGVALCLTVGAALAGESVRLSAASSTTAADQRTGQDAILVNLTGESAIALADFTHRHVNEIVDIRLDGHSVMKPVIREPLLGGMMMISGNFTHEEADRLAHRFVASDAIFEISFPAE